MRTFLKVLAGVAGLYLIGFLVFVLTLPGAISPNLKADGIVALTGGNARLDAAVALLERGAAHRLLITGVHPTTTKLELGLLLHGGKRFDCCADLGHQAADTRGNAEEAARWAHDHGYKSLIVVTANYHMPRSLTEFAAAMPGEKLVPYAVAPSDVDLSGWWHRPAMLHLLHSEYEKYLASFVMTRFRKPAALDRSDARHKVARG
jgi:uncharacterized SAM-binding protein YcdF (DUF218 family)